MSIEFLLIDPSGKEVDSVDPVASIRVESDHLIVDTGHFEYVAHFREGWKYELRSIDER